MQYNEMPLKLEEDRIDVWFACPDKLLSGKSRFEVLLSPVEAERAQNFRFDGDRNRYIIQHGIVRLLLAGYVGVEPNAVMIRSDARGKPYLAEIAGRKSPQFNLSSSDCHSAFAFSLSGSIGVDIEKIRTIEEMEGIALRHFTPNEKELVLRGAIEARVRSFYRIWVRKEAVLKAHGVGLLRGLDSVDVGWREGTGPWAVVLDGESGRSDYTVFDIDEIEGFASAVAATGHAGGVSIRHYEA
jgi:4'-phosphopantetheinyl transferase